MKLSSVFTLLLTICITSMSAQWGDNYIKLSERITSETKAVAGFDKLDISEDFEVYVYIGDTEKVVIEANENLHPLIIVENKDGRLKIDTKSYSTSSGGWGKHNGAREHLVAYITVKDLSEIKADEDVKIVLEDKISADELSIDLNEDSTLEGEIEADHLFVFLNEDSILDIEGSAHSMKVKAIEDSVFEGKRFVVGQLTMELKEDSVAKLTVNGDISLRAKEDSYFYYRGNGNFVRKHLTGDSEVRRW